MGMVSTDISRPGSQYTADQKTDACVRYAIKGTLAAVSRDTDIPETTLSNWVKSDWWQSLLVEIRAQKQDEHISRYHSLTEKALNKADKALDSLPEQLDATAIKNLVTTAAVSTDKARLLQSLPTSIRGDSSTVNSLVEQFNQLSREQTRISRDHDSIQASVVSDGNDNDNENENDSY